MKKTKTKLKQYEIIDGELDVYDWYTGFPETFIADNPRQITVEYLQKLNPDQNYNSINRKLQKLSKKEVKEMLRSRTHYPGFDCGKGSVYFLFEEGWCREILIRVREKQ